MPYAFDTYSGTGSQTDFNISFPYINEDHVKVYVNYVNTSFTFEPNKSTARLASAPASGVPVEVRRVTPLSSVLVDYADGSTLTAGDLDTNNLQHLYIAQELDDIQNKAISLSPTTGLPTAGNKRITEIADPTAAQDAVTKAYLERTGSITSTQLADGTIVNADVNASAAIAGTKISPNFGSQNIVTSGTVDGRDVSTDGTKLDGIETGATADQTNAEIRAAVEAASDSNVFTDADHTKLNGIEASATADQTNAEIRTAVEAASDSNVFTDADHTKLNAIEAGATADQTASEIKTLIASSPLDASHLAANSVTTSEIADAELTTLAGMQSGTASKLADSTALTADIADLNQIDGLTKQTTISDSDASFPTSGAVVDYVAAQIAPLGGLEVIATEVAFPNTQPASGVVISISDAGGVVFNGSGVSTTGRTVGGSTVTINGAPSSLNSETLVAGVGLMVSSTGSSQTYNYHKILGKEDDIKQLSDDINDFNARYRVASSNPTSALDAGDLFFNTSTQKLLVYNSTNSAWEEAQSIGNFFISTFSEAFDGSRTQFTLSNAPTSVQQIILSLNGVIQKPGTAFTLSGSTVTLASAPASGSDYFAVVMGSTVNIGTPSNNTVTSAILQNGSVIEAKLGSGAVTQAKIGDQAINEAKLQVSNAPTNGYFLSAQSGNTGGLTWAQVDTGVTSDGQNNTVAGTGAGDSFSGTDANGNALFGTNAGTAITTGDDNVGVGRASLEALTTGGNNVAIGRSALAVATTAGGNTAVGYHSLVANTSGAQNVAVGASAVDANTTGERNTGVGYQAMSANTTGVSNVAVGNECLKDNTTGQDNVAVGDKAMYENTTASENTAVGREALMNNTTGGENVAVGYWALRANTTAAYNVAVGRNAMAANTTGTKNTAVGSYALDANTTGDHNTCVGVDSIASNTTGASNTAMGDRALYSNTTASNNVGIGYKSLYSNTTYSNNTAVGSNAALNTTASNNTAIGSSALTTNSTGGSNVAVGRNALTANTTAGNNVAVGDISLAANTTGTANVAVGTGALTANTTGSYNTAVGRAALLNCTTGAGCVAVGMDAIAAFTTGANCNAVGYEAFKTATTAQECNAFGYHALRSLTTGNVNMGIGHLAGKYITTGTYNTCIGSHAPGFDITTGSNNICIGNDAGRSNSPSGSITSESERICLGNNSITNSYTKVAFTITSDERDKTDIQDITTGLAFVNQLKPKSFWFKKDRDSDVKHGDKRLGFLAQDILALEGSDPVIIDNDDTNNLKYKGEHLVPVLVNAIKELSAKVTALEAG